MPISYFVRRLLLVIPMLFGVVVVAFIVSHVVPGDPAAANLGQYAMGDPKIVAAYRHQWGLDQPLFAQFVIYLTRVFHGDLGVSQQTHRPVMEDLTEYFPATAELALAALMMAVVLGTLLGTIAALRRGKPVDYLCRFIGLVGVSVPVFWLGLVALELLYVRLSWLPGPGRLDESLAPPSTITGMYTVDSLLSGNWPDFWSSLGHMILPAAVLSGFGTGLFTRITRTALLDVLGASYIRTARAKGLPATAILVHHASRNALVPVLTCVGIAFGNLLTGAVLTETIFGWPGLGRYGYQAAINLDFPAIMGVTMLVATIYIIINLVVDLLYGVVDPRLRLGGP